MKDTDNKMEFNEIKQILDKLEKVGGRKSAKEIIKIIYAIALSIISLLVIAFICFVIFKNGLSVENVLSVLLAFFSMFISIFFYFKADETSNKFYDSSYNFMKDQSNVLGRIEERFGEKFESLISRFDHLETKKISTQEKIDTTQEEIIKTLNEAIVQLSQENQVTKEQLESYKNRLEQKSKDYHRFRNELSAIQNESHNLRFYLDSDNIEKFISSLSPKDMDYLIRSKRLQKSNKTYEFAKKYGLCDEDGVISQELKNYLTKKFIYEKF